MKSEIKQRILQLINGEIPDGYRKTDFGVFPCAWETEKTFGDLFDFYGGLSKSREELGKNGYPYLHYGDLHRGSFNKVSFEQYEQLPKCNISLTGKEACLMEDGDVAFLDASEDLEGTSRAVLIDNPDNKPFVAGLHIIYGKSKDNSLKKWYKQYITSSESVKKQFQRLAAGFKVYGVNRDTLPKIRIAYPPSLQEQSTIAEILMKWDEAIELYQQQIEKLNKLKRSALANLFPQKGKSTPKYRFAGFTDPWEQRKLGELSDRVIVGLATSVTPYYRTVGTPIFRNLNIKENYLDDTDILFLDETYANSQTGKKIHTGDVLTVHTGYIGTSCVVPEKYDDCLTFTTLITTTDATKLRGEFLSQYLNSEMGLSAVQMVTTQGGRQNLNTNDFVNVRIPYPSIDEQKKICELLRNLDNTITLHQRKVDTVAKQRAGLQQYLLNGIVRV